MYCPFIDGNPRRLNRIINVFNVGQRVAELYRGRMWSGMDRFKPKLLKFVILLEQWPYRPSARQHIAATYSCRAGPTTRVAWHSEGLCIVLN